MTWSETKGMEQFPMGTLSGLDGAFVSFAVTGYQFPDGVPGHDKYDENWLYIMFRVCDGSRRWDSRDAAWQTSDLPDLARWLRTAADGEQPGGAWTALEPLLSLECTESGVRPTIQAILAVELRSEDGKMSDLADETIELMPTREELLNAADAVEAGLRRFPPR